ncbi:MAG: DUF4321 domain-containing protein [Clostridia bacterium]|nr:DUF4321 domain-containing protein [Clostridia bacterium]
MMKFIKYTAFPVLCGIVFGMLIAYLTQDISALSWLSFGLRFGTENPFVLDLALVDFTFGIGINLNVATVICITLSLLIAKYINKK